MRALVGLILLGLLACSTEAQTASGAWENVSFGPEGPAIAGSFVSAMAAGPDGSVFASGGFGVAGGAAARQIARWDGDDWHPLGSGLDFYASDLAVGPGGALYAVGAFRNAGGVSVNAFAAWDGAAWRSFGSGPTNDSRDRAEAVAVGLDGTVYVAVNTYVLFSDYRYQVGRVVRWDGAAWVAVGAPFETTPGVSNVVYDLAVGADGRLHAGGSFGVRAWDGIQWTPVGALEGSVTVLTTDGAGRLYAGGRLSVSGAQNPASVARWDGAAWTGLGPPASISASVNALAATASGTVYVGGRFETLGETTVHHVARWDGVAWQPMAGGLAHATVGGRYVQTNVLALDTGGTLHVGGVFDRAGELLTPTLARWRDGAWVPGGGGINEAVRAIATDAAGRTVIGGQFRTAGGRPVNHVAVRNGNGWDRIGAGLSDVVTALERDRNGALVACSYGTFRWDGAAWADMRLGPQGSRCMDLTTGPGGDVYAAGYWADGVPTTVQRWNGAAWASLGNPGLFTEAVAVDSSGTLYAGGRYGVARYDGRSWQTIGAITAGSVYALAIGADGALYAGGLFDAIGGTAAANVARWDGAAWRPLGAGVGGAVRALAVDARGLYVGGEFRSAGAHAAAHVALWDGAAWSALGEGTDGTVSVLQRDGPNGLLVGGRFGRAGTLASPFVARWTSTPVAAEAPVPAAQLALTVVPNPARGSAVAHVTHPSGPVTVDVFDSLGRLVEVAATGEAPGGDRAVTLRLDGLAPGVYVVRLRASASSLSRVLVVAR